MEEILFDFKEAEDRFFKDNEAHYRTFVRVAANQLLRQLNADDPIDMFAPGILEEVSKKLRFTAKSVNKTTAKAIENKIRNIVTSGIQNLESIATIKSKIHETLVQYYKNIEETRSGLIARTESQGMGNFGRMSGMSQAGFDFHTWLDSGDKQVRDDHSVATGTTVKVGDPFTLGSGYGGDPSYPSDVNERCVTVPARNPQGA